MEKSTDLHKKHIKELKDLEKNTIGNRSTKDDKRIQKTYKKQKPPTMRGRKRRYDSKGIQTDCTDLQDCKQEKITDSFFYRLVAVIVEITPGVIQRYFDHFVLQGQSFEEYLETKKHVLFHIYETTRCCQCGCFSSKLTRPSLTKTQFLVLFSTDSNRYNFSHMRKQDGRTTQVCLCSWIARPNISTKVLDISLAQIILKNCATFQLGADAWMKKITEIRNEIFHKSDIKALTKAEFVDLWHTLSSSISGLTNLISPEYNTEVQCRIDMLLGRVMISREKWQLEQLCLDYWKQKSAELEAYRKEEVRTFQMLLEGLSDGDRQTHLLGRKLRSVMTRIDDLSCRVNEVSVNVFGNVDIFQIMNQTDLDSSKSEDVIPVLMQLKVPSAWDWAKIEESIENIRSKMTSLAPNIQIKTCSDNNLTFLIEILRNMMANRRLFQKELYDLMNWLLQESLTDTQTCASVDILLSAYNNSPREEKLPAKFLLNMNKRVFQGTWPQVTDCLEMQNGELVFLVKTQFDACRICKFDIHLCNIQEESAPIGSLNLMICGGNTVAILGTSRLHFIRITPYTHIAVISLPEDNIPATSFSFNEFLIYTNNTLLQIDCKGKPKRKLAIVVKDCYLLHASNKFLYLFCRDKQLLVCTLDGREIQTITFPEKVCSCTTVPDGGLVAVCNSSSIFYINADGSKWSFMESGFEPMTSIHVVRYCKQTKTFLFCHNFNSVSVYYV